MTNIKRQRKWAVALIFALTTVTAQAASGITVNYGTTKVVSFTIRAYQSYTNGGYWYNTYLDYVEIPGTITIGGDSARATIDWSAMRWSSLGSCRNAEIGSMDDCFNKLTGNASACNYALTTSYYPCHNGKLCDNGDASSGGQRDTARSLMRSKLKGLTTLNNLVTIPRGSSGLGDHNALGSSTFQSASPAANILPHNDPGTSIGSDICLYDVVRATAN